VPVCLQFVICDTFGCVLKIDACVCYTGDLDHTTHNTRSYSTCMVHHTTHNTWSYSTCMRQDRQATSRAAANPRSSGYLTGRRKSKIVRLPHEPPVPVCLHLIICDTFGRVLQFDVLLSWTCVSYADDLEHTTHNTRSCSHTTRNTRSYSTCMRQAACRAVLQTQDREATSRPARNIYIGSNRCEAGTTSYEHIIAWKRYVAARF
jgi:hypothetical protein